MSKGLVLSLGGAALAITSRFVFLKVSPEGGYDFVIHSGTMLIMAFVGFMGVWFAPNGKPLDLFKAGAKLTSIFAIALTIYVLLEHTMIYPEGLIEKKRVALDYMEHLDFDSIAQANPEQFRGATRSQWADGHEAWITRTTSPKMIASVTFFGYLLLGLVYSAFSAIFGPKIKS